VAGLCAVHALNSLLQGPYYTEIDLMQIAQEFDKKEKAVMAEMGETNDFIKFVAEDSGNVADDGNYSVQVVVEALKVWDVEIISIDSKQAGDAKQNPLDQEAFICNLASHWLTIRKINGDWFNFNSMLNKPQFLSTFYLSAFMDTLQDKGYAIFVVKGKLPVGIPNEDSSNWQRIPCKPSKQSPSEISRTTKRRRGEQQVITSEQLNSEMAAAIRASLSESDDSAQMAAALEESLKSRYKEEKKK